MTDDELKKMVRHLAEIHGVSPEAVIETVAEGHEPEGGFDAVGEVVEDEEPERRKLWRPGVWVMLGGVGAVFGLCIVILLNFVNGSEKVGPDVNKVLGEAKASIAPSPGVLPEIKGLHITFSYPNGFGNASPVRDKNAGLEGYVLNTQAVGHGGQIAVQVVKLPSGQLDDNSGYLWRTTVSKDYERPLPTKVLDEPAQIIKKKDGTEQTLYWPHAKMLVLVSVTTSSGGDVASYLNTVQTSLRWLQ